MFVRTKETEESYCYILAYIQREREKNRRRKNDLLRAFLPISRLYIPENHLGELSESKETQV